MTPRVRLQADGRAIIKFTLNWNSNYYGILQINCRSVSACVFETVTGSELEPQRKAGREITPAFFGNNLLNIPQGASRIPVFIVMQKKIP